MKKINISDNKLKKVEKEFNDLIKRMNKFQFDAPKPKKGLYKEPFDLECGVVPQGTFLQRISRLFRREKDYSLETFRKKMDPEYSVGRFQHRLELIRTIATSINLVGTICVLLRVFKVL